MMQDAQFHHDQRGYRHEQQQSYRVPSIERPRVSSYSEHHAQQPTTMNLDPRSHNYNYLQHMASYVDNAMKITKKLGLDKPVSNSNSNSNMNTYDPHQPPIRDEGQYSAKETLTLSGTMSGFNFNNASSKHLTNDEIQLRQQRQGNRFDQQNDGEESFDENNDDGQFSQTSQEEGEMHEQQETYGDQSSELTKSEHAEMENGFKGDQKTSDLQSDVSKEPPRFEYKHMN